MARQWHVGPSLYRPSVPCLQTQPFAAATDVVDAPLLRTAMGAPKLCDRPGALSCSPVRASPGVGASHGGPVSTPAGANLGTCGWLPKAGQACLLRLPRVPASDRCAVRLVALTSQRPCCRQTVAGLVVRQRPVRAMTKRRRPKTQPRGSGDSLHPGVHQPVHG